MREREREGWGIRGAHSAIFMSEYHKNADNPWPCPYLGGEMVFGGVLILFPEEVRYAYVRVRIRVRIRVRLSKHWSLCKN